MGIYRMFLAIMVLLSHSGIYYYGFNQGIVSVVAFLIMTGYTTEIVLERKESFSLYIRKKIIRIFPLYWFYVVITLVLVCKFHLQHETIHNITITSLIGNMLLLPLDYSSISWMNRLLAGNIVIPAAWTLGSQFTYYLIAPVLHKLKNNKKGRIINAFLFVSSFTLFMFASMGYVDSAHGYTLITGTLWIYMIGMCIRDNDYNIKATAGIWSVCMVIFLYGFSADGMLQQGKLIMLGVVLNLPVIYFLLNYPAGKIDKLIGKLSYGVYLNHFTVKTVLVNCLNHEPMKFNEWFIEIVISVLIAFIGYYIIENPIKKLEKKILKIESH